MMDNANRAAKAKAIEAVKGFLDPAESVVIVHYKGMTVTEVTELRRKARLAGVGFKVSKNRLAKIAMKDTKFAQLADLLTGPTAISYSKDALAAAKVIVQFAKTNDKLVVLGGAMGDKALDIAAIKTLAELPSLDEIRSKLISLIQAPASQIARVVKASADKREKEEGSAKPAEVAKEAAAPAPEAPAAEAAAAPEAPKEA